MRLQRLQIIKWRNFRDVIIDLPADTKIVCLVGENGSGKTGLLELVAQLAERAGLSTGIDLPRGEPLREPHELHAVFDLSEQIDVVASDLKNIANVNASRWDGKLSVSSQNSASAPKTKVLAGGPSEEPAQLELGSAIAQWCRASQDPYYLSIDSERSYPTLGLNVGQMAEASRIDWNSLDHRKRRSHASSRSLYGEWQNYLVALSQKAAIALSREASKAQTEGRTLPLFIDPLTSYRERLTKILPHLTLDSADLENGVLFRTGDQRLPLSSLSSGEKEIAFIVGQIERFQLQNGLLLIDEPELHLNPNLVRSWVSFLVDNVASGQTWLATHSHEVVESLKASSVLMLEKEPKTNAVRSVKSFQKKPTARILSDLMGAPGFSLINRVFVLVEGEHGRNEDERFKKIVCDGDDVYYVASGGCEQVATRFKALQTFSNETGEGLRLCAVVDRDFRSDEQCHMLAEGGIHVLACHEIENLYLQPSVVEALRQRNEVAGTADEIIRAASDAFAGVWIVDRSASRTTDLKIKVPDLWDALRGSNFSDLGEQVAGNILLHEAGDSEERKACKDILLASIAGYTEARNGAALWKSCCGKQVVHRVAQLLGFGDRQTFVANVLGLWKAGTVAHPVELESLREYVASKRP